MFARQLLTSVKKKNASFDPPKNSFHKHTSRNTNITFPSTRWCFRVFLQTQKLLFATTHSTVTEWFVDVEIPGNFTGLKRLQPFLTKCHCDCLSASGLLLSLVSRYAWWPRVCLIQSCDASDLFSNQTMNLLAKMVLIGGFFLLCKSRSVSFSAGRWFTVGFPHSSGVHQQLCRC